MYLDEWKYFSSEDEVQKYYESHPRRHWFDLLLRWSGPGWYYCEFIYDTHPVNGESDNDLVIDSAKSRLECLEVDMDIIKRKIEEAKSKTLLLNCLEHHFGSLEKCVVEPDEPLKP